MSPYQEDRRLASSPLPLRELRFLECPLFSEAGRYGDARPAEIGSTDVVPKDGLAFFDVLAQIDPHRAEGDLLITKAAVRPSLAGEAELLKNLKLNGTFNQVAVAVDADAHRNDLGVAVLDAVVCDGTFWGPAPMLTVKAVRQIPFDQGILPRRAGRY